MKFATRCVHPPRSDDPHGATAPPLYQTATFRQPTATEFGEYDYSRSGNPTRAALEAQLAALDGGLFACAFSSGMAALAAVINLVPAGGRIVAGDDLYGGTVRLLAHAAKARGVSVVYADAADPAAFAAATPGPDALWLVETPTNPWLRIADLRGLAAAGRAAGAILAVDNSLLSPVLQRPLALGSSLVVQSATKFLGGHSDLTGGAVVTDDPGLHERIAFLQNAEGAGLAPFESWLLLRGLKTLAVRVKAQQRAAQAVAEFLAGHPSVRGVNYPGLPGHPARALHFSQADGAGAVLSFTTGDAEFSRRVVEGCRLFSIAVSFGSVHSVITLPGRMSHASIPEALRDRLAPPPDLIRLSVGLEAPDELLEDLARALDAADRPVAIAAPRDSVAASHSSESRIPNLESRTDPPATPPSSPGDLS